jgi:hypothetical protein
MAERGTHAQARASPLSACVAEVVGALQDVASSPSALDGAVGRLRTAVADAAAAAAAAARQAGGDSGQHTAAAATAAAEEVWAHAATLWVRCVVCRVVSCDRHAGVAAAALRP